jgi:predicted SAM-dependent methyltransferase
MLRVNIGCGATPTPGWLNLDNSPTVRIARHDWLLGALRKFGVLKGEQLRFAETARAADIRWLDATQELPFADDSVEVLYSSHMLEHLDGEEARAFLREVRRVLLPDGVVRLVVPDLQRLVDEYNADADADRFVRGTYLAVPRPRGITQRVRAMLYGHREHHWMYNAESLSSLLVEVGFRAPRILRPGETTITSPGQLDLRERASESLYVEARK